MVRIRQIGVAASSMWLLVVLPVLVTTALAPPSLIQSASKTYRREATTTTTRTSSQLQMGFWEGLLATATSKAPSSSKKVRPKVQVPDDFQIPEPKPLTITKGTDLGDFVKSSLAFVLRLGTGAFTLGWKIDSLFFVPPQGGDNDDDDGNSKQYYSLKLGPFSIRDTSTVLTNAPKPDVPLVLYEYDASPFCKRVREMINLLDLTVEYRPCPGARQGKFSDELFERTGRRTVPYLIDPNTGTELFESGDQIEYLLKTYGPTPQDFDRKALWPITFQAFSVYTSTLVAVLREFPASKRQQTARPDNEDMEPLELWGYESSPFVRPVREKLGSLCLPHVMVSCPRGSANRDKMMERTGRFQVPFLVDPNTGIEMFEGPEIVRYLEAVYTTTQQKVAS
jgi:glutathione S-transferase